jgi:circadian clock protein KaiC
MTEDTSRRQPTREIRAGVEKTPTGIEGFDEITGGGLPRGRTSLVFGAAGTGKTIFGLQTVVNGVRRWGEPGVVVAFEEPSAQIVENATFGWQLEELMEDEVFFLDARLSPDTLRAGAFDLAGMLATLDQKVETMGAKRVVFDSLDVMLRLLDDPTRQRQEVYRIHDWLSEREVTGLITLRLDGPNPHRPLAHSFLPFIADCVVWLSQRVEDRVAMRSLRVVKYRGSSFQENEVPFVIGPRGIEVAHMGREDIDYTVSAERVSTGIAGLDDMLRGGVFRGTSTVVTGASGTAKTTLAGAFAAAACRRGECTLYVCFDESAEEIRRNLLSVDIDLEPYIESGDLRMMAAQAESRNADEHLLRIRAAIDELGATCVVVDPVSAILKAGGPVPGLSVARRLIYQAKEEGITLLCTSLLPRSEPAHEGAPLKIWTLADTWIHLSYEVKQRERTRAITIVKSRGTGHSNEVRELVLSDEGVGVRDVHAPGGEVSAQAAGRR